MEREWWPRRSHLIHLSVHSKVTDWLCAGVWWIRQMRAGWHFSRMIGFPEERGWGSSLVVPRLRLCTPNVGSRLGFPGGTNTFIYFFIYIYIYESHSVMSDSLWPHGLYSPWNSPGQNTGVGSLSLLQGIFPTQGSNPGLMHCRQILYQLSHKGSPKIYIIFQKEHEDVRLEAEVVGGCLNNPGQTQQSLNFLMTQKQTNSWGSYLSGRLGSFAKIIPTIRKRNSSCLHQRTLLEIRL